MHWKALLGIFLVFILGVLTGSFGASAYLIHKQAQFIKAGPIGVTQALERRLNHDLRLDPDQRQQVHQILTDAEEQIRNTRREIQPQLRAIQVQARQRIAALLRLDQQDQYHKLLLAMKKHQAQNGFNPDNQVGDNLPANPTHLDNIPTPIPPPATNNVQQGYQNTGT